MRPVPSPGSLTRLRLIIRASDPSRESGERMLLLRAVEASVAVQRHRIEGHNLRTFGPAMDDLTTLATLRRSLAVRKSCAPGRDRARWDLFTP